MPDLWKALGDVYGDREADAPPVRREPPAGERATDPARFNSTLPLDDDLAAALSAALVNAPSPGTAVAPGAAVARAAPLPPVAPLAPPVSPSPVPLRAPVSMQPAPAPVPSPSPLRDALAAVAPAAPAAPAVPLAPATTPVVPNGGEAQGDAQERVTTWIAEIEDRNRRRDEGPDLDAAVPRGDTWARADDDILPRNAKRRLRLR